jgi:uncharacterized protein (DUF608 family)
VHNNKPNNKCSCSGSCSSTNKFKLSRRDFVKLTTSSVAVASGLGGFPLMAGPFQENEYLKIITEDKKLDPAWVDSLYARGEKQVYTNPEALKHIGMPVGGLFAGTVYLSGDGRLWLWDIFNRDQEGIRPRSVTYKGGEIRTRDGANYIDPAEIDSPFEQGFYLRLNDNGSSKDIPLNTDGFEKVTFNGQYPMAAVNYESSSLPVKAALKAYSPFVPLSLDDSSLPATIMKYTITNTSKKKVDVDIYGKMQNPICMETRDRVEGQLVNTIIRGWIFSVVQCSALPVKEPAKSPRQDILFEDFEKESYDGWTVEGKAFADGPVKIKDIPDYQGDVAGKGKQVVNSHSSAPGKDIGEKDGSVGTLTSRTFKIERNYINFLIGGGAHKNKTCINLLIDDKVVASATGKNNNRMTQGSFNVKKFQGQTAKLQIVDNFTGAWGNIGVDHIVFTDQKITGSDLTEQRDYGTMALAVVGRTRDNFAFAADGPDRFANNKVDLDEKLVGTVGRKLQLEPNESKTVSFVVAWCFPNFKDSRWGHYYATKFRSALEVARHVTVNFERLTTETEKWVKTWYDSTLPYWLLDRTMANTSTLATTTCYRLADGRFWAWEGIGCCHGTCTHVWHYAQAPGRIFPEFERTLRERTDFGIGQHDDGGVGMRAGLDGSNEPAHDGQCGRILGAYREHQMSADEAFLRRIWPNVKKAMQYLIRLDKNNDGLIEGAQPNTLDAAWYGKVSFLQSLYIAALKASEAMATEMGDTVFAEECGKIATNGAKTIEELFNGEYFVQIEDPAHKKEVGVGPGCYIDQIFGQSWAHQVALGRLFDKDKQLSALRALWKYNFVPDVGPFRENFQRGRWYAAAGDAGLVMCTWPKGGQNPNFKDHWQYMYFNECMSGFEWQVASHMVYEGMLKEGLGIARAIHDRYNAALRNPYNEIECSDHYARAMASYGVFISISGFEYHGPKGQIAFSPRLSPEDFRSAFITAQGWGTFSQKRKGNTQAETLSLNWGRLSLEQMEFDLPAGKRAKDVKLNVNNKSTESTYRMDKNRVVIALMKPAVIEAGRSIEVSIKY